MWWLHNFPGWMYFQLDIESHWWLLSGSTLNVSLSPCRPILVAPFLSPSFTVQVCACICGWVWETVCVCVCVCVSLFGTCDGETDTCTLCSCQYIFSFRQTDRGSGARLTQLHRFIQEEMQSSLPRVTASGDCQLVNPRHTHTHTHTQPVLWTQLPDVIQALSSNQMNPTGP